MSIYTNKAVELFKKTFKRKKLISPISDSDVQIVESLVGIIESVSDLDVREVMDEYKFLKDSEIISNLQLLIGQVASEAGEVDDESPEKYFIQLSDLFKNKIRKTMILGYRVGDVFSEDYGDERPCLILNECDPEATKKPMYANHVLIYKNEDVRKRDILTLSLFCI